MKRIFVLSLAFISLFVLSGTTSAVESTAAEKSPDIYEAAGSREHSEIVVLVPGFFSSFAKPYFSSDIIQTIQSEGYSVAVADQLDPMGKVANNSQALLSLFRSLHRKFPERSMIVIGHSLGGIYTLLAMDQDRQLPIHKVITLATPYDGVGVVDGVDQKLPGVGELAKFLNLESLLEMRRTTVQAILRDHPIPAGVHWVALGGIEKKCFLLTCALPERLSWLMSIGQFFIGREASDGIVTYNSALARGSNLQIERWEDPIPLEHWEMVLPHSVFSTLGVGQTTWIRDQQIKLYRGILEKVPGT